MKSRTYATPAAFKAALEQRLRDSSKTGVGLARHRQLLVFDRFLARVMRVLGNAAMLKGGLVLELRLERARTTRDVDLRLDAPPEDTLARLQEAGRADLGDFMTFEIQPDAQQPEMDFEGRRNDGFRYRAQCRLAGQIYGQRFGVDVAFADPVLGEPDLVVAEDVLAFARIEPPKLRLYPVETHLAEKLHAYTLPRDRPNPRVKDLPDLALLGTIRSLEATRVRKALQQTFSFGKTHELPESLPAPPAAWARPYARMAEDDDLPWRTLEAVTLAAKDFLDPLLGGARLKSWKPGSWAWSRVGS
jgi:predicted nucleotidyltransferase component of viral defense system